jgi:nitrogen fixation protein FixH
MSAAMDRMQGEGKDGGARRSRWIPWAFVGFFVVLAAIQGVMIWFAIESFSGLTAEDAYQRGIAYNQTLAAKEAETALGWQVTLAWRADRSGPAKGRLELKILDRLGQPLQGAEVSARLRRPVGPDNTTTVALKSSGPGLYGADLALALRGQWDVDLDIMTAHGADHLTDRIFAP